MPGFFVSCLFGGLSPQALSGGVKARPLFFFRRGRPLLSRLFVIVLFLVWKGIRLFQPIRAQLRLDIFPNELPYFL